MMRSDMRRSPALPAPVSKVDPAASTRDGKAVQLVCLSLVLAVAALGLRIASIL